MEKGKGKGKAVTNIAANLEKLDINSPSTSLPYTANTFPALHSSVLPLKRMKPPSLVSLCIAVIGKHLEDIILDLGEIASGFPSYIKMAIAAIARRRKLLNDDVIISLADDSWEVLDVSCSDVSDFGLAKVAEMCRSLRAVDISHCSKITPHGVFQLAQHCHSLEILRCGGCPRSDYTARRSLGIFKPELKNVEGDSWEELDTTDITHGGHSLQWLVWPKIDADCLESFSSECPRVKVNPQPSPICFNGVLVPREALPDIVLDDPVVADIDPSTWASGRPATKMVTHVSSPSELSVAEKFRLAFVERDMRLAPKRAKNARQRLRRAEKEWMMTSPEAKAVALASRANKSFRGKN